MQQDDDLEVSIFDWACQAVSDTDMARQEVSLLNAKYAQQQKVIDQLQTQLDDLVKRKEEHEETLLNKFQQLLNSKKLKIRDQQRLLASAKIDPETGRTKNVKPNLIFGADCNSRPSTAKQKFASW